MSKAKRKWLIVFASAAVVVSGFIALGLFEQSEAARMSAAAQKSAEAIGIPLTLEEFRRLLPDPNSPQNGWPDYVAAIRTYAPGFDPMSQRQVGDSRTEESRVVGGAFRALRRGRQDWAEDGALGPTVDRLRPALARIREAQKKPLFVIEKPWERGSVMTMPETIHFSLLARLYFIEAIVAAQGERFDDALRELGAGARIGADLMRQPALAYQNLGASIAADGLGVIDWLLCTGTWPIERAVAFHPSLAVLSQSGDLKLAFKSHVLLGLVAFRETTSPENLDEIPRGWEDGVRITPRPGAREESERQWLELGASILKRWPIEESLEAVRAALNKDDAKMGEVQSLFFQRAGFGQGEGVFGRALENLAAREAQLRLTIALLSLLENKRVKGDFPAVLAEMMLEGEPMLDPFSGKPFHYARTDDGFVLYSVGRDKTDNKGTARSDNGMAVDLVIQYPSSRLVW